VTNTRNLIVRFDLDDGFGGQHPIRAEVLVRDLGGELESEVVDMDGPTGNDGQELPKLQHQADDEALAIAEAQHVLLKEHEAGLPPGLSSRLTSLNGPTFEQVSHQELGQIFMNGTFGRLAVSQPSDRVALHGLLPALCVGVVKGRPAMILELGADGPLAGSLFVLHLRAPEVVPTDARYQILAEMAYRFCNGRHVDEVSLAEKRMVDALESLGFRLDRERADA
jgi:hypothetical protein